MALILAIEPGRNQAQQIALMAAQHLKGAELVTAATADAALAAVGGRIPDLILIPALLPPRDEHALTDYLRQLGAAASHVHTLAVPILEAARPHTADHGSGLLGRRREKPQSLSVGCEPSVFAEQIKVYLKQAAREREASAGEGADAPPDEHPDEVPIRLDDFEEIVWLPAGPEGVDAPADEPRPVIEPAPIVVPEPTVEKRKPRVENAATRAFEAEFGLPPSASTSPPLWRVTEEGIEALAVEPPETVPELPVVVPEPPAVVVAEPPPARPKTRTLKTPKTRKPAPPLDDWAYFDPQQSPFKALVKRLDEIAGLTAGSSI